MRTRLICCALTVMLLGLAALGYFSLATASQDGTGGATPVAVTAVVREVLSDTAPDSAPGEVFELVRYTIAPGAVLPVHTHPGVQMAIVESGSLTYHVVDNGNVTVTRADGAEEVIQSGETVTFEVGDAWVEPEGMVHYAENLTDEPVVLIATSLLGVGEPTAILIDEATSVD